MTHFDVTRGLLLALLAACSACSAHAECDARDDGYNGKVVASDALTGSVVLSQSGQTETFSFASTVSGLPELWPSNSAISNGRFGIGLTLRYAIDPIGGDGATQMPRLSVAFNTPPLLFEQTPPATTQFPGPAASSFESRLFDTCLSADDGHCCPFGAQQCTEQVRVTITRLDGAPFPPLTVNWSAGADAQISSCPAENDKPSLVLLSEPE
jgi:hypothetical protein